LVHCLRDAARRKRPQKWFPHHDNVTEHHPVLAKDFLAKSNMTALKIPPYCPHLTPADFYLYLRLKLTSKGLLFCDTTKVIKNATEELKRLLKNIFHECFQKLFSFWQKSIDANGTVLQEV